MNQERNPATDYFQEKDAAKEERKKKEIDLWHTWKTQGKKPEHLEPLLKAYDSNLNSKVRQWKAPNVPASAFKLALQGHLVKAFDTYDPSRGAALNTWAESKLQKAKRDNARMQNLAYIPEGQIERIAPIQKAINALTEELGREPTNQEIADHVTENTNKPITAKRVEVVRKSQRKDIPGSVFENDPVPRLSNFEEQQLAVAANILPTLFPGKPQMATLFNHIYGTNEHEQITSTTALAKKFGTNLSQISRMKKQLGATLRQHMGIKLPGEGDDED
jgi:DNA-directed RNA polymerase specialized sigma subunit